MRKDSALLSNKNRGHNLKPFQFSESISNTNVAKMKSWILQNSLNQGNLQTQYLIGNLQATQNQIIQEQSEKSKSPVTPIIPQILEKLPDWFMDKPGYRGKLSEKPVLREILLTLYARMGTSFWNQIPQKGISYVSEQGELDFETKDVEGVRKFLVSLGYTPSYFAKASADVWGLREPTLPTAGLHVRGGVNKVNVHIDLHPPMQTGIYHWLMDADHWFYKSRKKSHTPEALREGVEKLGQFIPVLYQQKVHGDITARLERLTKEVKGHPDVQAEIDEGKAYLALAGSVLWNRNVVSQADLANAIWYLGLASACAYGAEQLSKKK